MDHVICSSSSDDLRNSESLDSQPEQVADQSLPDSEAAATWSFCALVRGGEWDPSLLTTLFNERRPTLAPTLDIATILSYARKNQSNVVPAGHVAVEGYLKLKASRQAKRGTLRRHFMHPDLIMTRTACSVGKNHRYTDHDFISRCMNMHE